MKKLISAALCGIMLAAALVGCGGSSSQKTYNLDDVVAAVEKVNEVANPLAMDDFAIENDVGLNWMTWPSTRASRATTRATAPPFWW